MCYPCVRLSALGTSVFQVELVPGGPHLNSSLRPEEVTFLGPGGEDVHLFLRSTTSTRSRKCEDINGTTCEEGAGVTEEGTGRVMCVISGARGEL